MQESIADGTHSYSHTWDSCVECAYHEDKNADERRFHVWEKAEIGIEEELEEKPGG